MQNPDTPPPDGCVAAILPAAGSGRRFGDQRNKLFANLAGQPLWYHSARRLARRREVGRLVMAIAAVDRDMFSGPYRTLVEELGIELVDGGAERTDSVRAGLEAIGDDEKIELVAVHDAARPLVSDADLTAVITTAGRTAAALLATPMSGTVKRDLGELAACATVDRRDLWIALTPQVFRIGVLREAYAKHRGRGATDDAQLVERIGRPVTLVPGSADNLKITHPEDLSLAEAILARQADHA